MKKISALVFGALLLSSSLSFADSFAEKCADAVSCTKTVSQILGQKYVYDGEFKGKWESTANLELTKDNAELLFTNMLYGLNYTRLPLAQPNTFQIMRIRDAKDSAIPTYYGSAKQDPKLPETWDYATLVYTTVDPAVSDNIARILRNFMPPNTRIVSTNGKLFVTDALANLKKNYSLIREMDTKPTPEQKKKWAEEEKHHQMMMEKMHDQHEHHEMPPRPDQAPPKKN